jgi:hypothetical protein
MADVRLYRKDDLTGFTVSRERADFLIANAGYTESYNEAESASYTLGGINYSGVQESQTPSNSTQLTQDAKNRITKQGQLKFGNLLSQPLLDKWVEEYLASGGDESSAIGAVRQTPEYAQQFAGNLNEDGVTVKYSEAEYGQILDGYKRKIEAVNLNPDVILSAERKEQLIDNVVSPDELGARISAVQSNILNSIPEVKEFYLRNFNRVLTDEEILVSAIDPKIGEDIISGTISSRDVVSQRITTAQLGAEALLAGTDITVGVAEELRALGLSVDAARRGFQQVRGIQQQALAQGRDVPSVQDILEGTELGQSEELRQVINIIRQQESASAVQLGATQAQTGAVTGLVEA